MVLMPGFQSIQLATEGALEPFFFLYTDDSIQGNPETCKQSSIMLNYEVKNILRSVKQMSTHTSTVNFVNIPAELKSSCQFCTWKMERGAKSSRLTKVPYKPGTNRKAQTNNPDTFSDFTDAMKRSEEHTSELQSRFDL